MLKLPGFMKRSLVHGALGAALAVGAGSALAATNFQNDVAQAINSGLTFLTNRGVYSNSPPNGDATGIAIEALLEKRASGNPTDPPQGYVGAIAADQALLRSAVTYLITQSNANGNSFYAYRDGAWMFALSGYALTNGPDKSVLGTPLTIKAAMDQLVDRTLAQQTLSGQCSGFWSYTSQGCDSSTTQFASAGLNAARQFYQSAKSGDTAFADMTRAANITTALNRTRAGYQLNAKAGSDNGGCATVSSTERGIGYQATGYNPSLQQTASGIYIQLFGGADVNDASLQTYMQWLKNHYRYSTLDNMGNSWAGPSWTYYLWSSFKGMELIRQSGVAPNVGNVGPSDLGTVAADVNCNVRETNIDPSTVARIPLFGANPVGYYNSEVKSQYFDYAYTLLSMQCGSGSNGYGYTGVAGSFTCGSFYSPSNGYAVSDWEGGQTNTAHNAYAILVLQRATGVVVEKCNVNGDSQIDSTDIAKITGAIGKTAAILGSDFALYDANSDGKINITDVRLCTAKCTKTNCAP
jgi:hypothetical protein